MNVVLASPPLTTTPTPTGAGEIGEPPQTGAGRDGGGGGTPPWVVIGFGLGIATLLAGGAFVLLRSRVHHSPDSEA